MSGPADWIPRAIENSTFILGGLVLPGYPKFLTVCIFAEQKPAVLPPDGYSLERFKVTFRDVREGLEVKDLNAAMSVLCGTSSRMSTAVSSKPEECHHPVVRPALKMNTTDTGVNAYL